MGCMSLWKRFIRHSKLPCFFNEFFNESDKIYMPAQQAFLMEAHG